MMATQTSIKFLVAGLMAAGTFAHSARAESPTVARRGPTVAGRPNLNGIWRTLGTANWDLEDHGSEPGPFYQLGAVGAIPAGRGVVEGGAIPYKPEALAQRNKNRANRWKEDPEVKCYMPGIPRAAYMPHPFQIVQSNDAVLMVYQYASVNRVINLGKPIEPSVDTWMGTANGHWAGQTLVVDNRGFNDSSWFDRAGNFHSDQLHVVERYMLADKDHIRYEATIEDPQTFTRPWKIAMTLYRDVDAHPALAEFKCVEFSEELLYGDLSRKPAK